MQIDYIIYFTYKYDMNNKRLLITSFFVLCLPIIVFAHPHISIYSSCDFTFEGSELDGVWIDFKFDTFFSADILSSFDEDGNNLFNDSEIRVVYENYFINLQKYGFFISIRDNNGRTTPEQVENFSVYAEDGNVHYRFFIHLESPIDRELYLSVSDPTFFCACKYIEDKPVNFVNSKAVQPDYQIVENNDNPIYYDPYASTSDTGTYERWEPGLQACFPKEIHLVF